MAHPEVIEKLRDVSVAARTLQRDQVPEDVVGAAVFFSGPAVGVRDGTDDGDRRRRSISTDVFGCRGRISSGPRRAIRWPR